MFYIVALGNPGETYKRTRHNIGWFVADNFCEQYNFSPLETVKPWQAHVRKGQVNGSTVWVVYPYTFMNRSGETVRAILKDDTDAEVVIVHDEIAIPLGSFKFSVGRGAAGHNGVRSIMEHTKDESLTRLRVGVAGKHLFTGATKTPTGADLPKYVLGNFSMLERSTVTAVCVEASTALALLVAEGVAAAMNEYN